MRSKHTGSFRRNRRGTAALEFGLMVPVLLALVTGATEIGMAAFESMQVQNAAEAGALYASQHQADAAGIQNAVLTATGTAGITASPAPVGFCGCPGAGGVTAGDCTTLCPGGDAQGKYVRVSAAMTHSKILSLPGLPNPLVLTGVSTLRVP